MHNIGWAGRSFLPHENFEKNRYTGYYLVNQPYNKIRYAHFNQICHNLTSFFFINDWIKKKEAKKKPSFGQFFNEQVKKQAKTNRTVKLEITPKLPISTRPASWRKLCLETVKGEKNHLNTPADSHRLSAFFMLVPHQERFFFIASPAKKKLCKKKPGWNQAAFKEKASKTNPTI